MAWTKRLPPYPKVDVFWRDSDVSNSWTYDNDIVDGSEKEYICLVTSGYLLHQDDTWVILVSTLSWDDDAKRWLCNAITRIPAPMVVEVVRL